MRYFFLLLALLPFVGQAQSQTADSLIAKVESVYASVETYSDTGVVETQFFSKSGRESHKSVQEFSTLFVRNRIFRFSYARTDTPFSYYGFQWDSTNQVVSRTFGKTNTYKKDSPNELIAGATGVSSGSSHTVSKLLLPKTISGRKLFANPESYVLAGIDEIEGISCYRLELPGKNSYREAIWIEKESFLIRQIQSVDNVISTTSYQSAINFDAHSVDLAYNPRKEGRMAHLNNLPQMIWEVWDIMLMILFLIIVYFQRRRHKKLILESKEQARRSMLLQRWTKIIMLVVFILLMAVEHIPVSGNYAWITLSVILFTSLIMIPQYIPISDHLFKQRHKLIAVVFALILLAVFAVIMWLTSSDLPGFFWSWYPIMAAFIIVYATIMAISSQRHHRRLINRTPFDHSETNVFSQKAGFFQDDKFLTDGRLLLLSDRLILISEIGENWEISRSSILDIEVKNFLWIWPHKLALITQNPENFEIRITMPYYWRKKILEH